MVKRTVSLIAAVLLGSVVAAQQQAPAQPPAAAQQAKDPQPPTAVPQLPAEPEPLRPTIHAALPQNVDDYWFAPAKGERVVRNVALTDAAAAYVAGNYASALAHARTAAAAGGELGVYAEYYVAVSELRLAHAAEAQKAFDAVLAKKPDGALSVDAAVGRAEAMELRGDHAGAVDVYESLTSNKGAAQDDILARTARAALAAGDRKRAAEAWLRVYYEFPLSDAALSAGDALNSLQDVILKRNDTLDLGRALVLFGAKRYPESRNAFQDLQPRVSGDDRELVRSEERR